MARFYVLVLAASALVLVAPSHQQYYFPYYSGGVNDYQRLFFGGALLPNALVRTTTTTSTLTVSATCTKKVDNACDPNVNPFPNGFARSLAKDFEEDQIIIPSNTASVEPTTIPQNKRQAPHFPAGYFYSHHGGQFVDSSIVPAAGYYHHDGALPLYPGAAPQARLFFTRTLTSTTVSTSTRTLTPGCSKAGFFTQCS